MLYNLPLFPTAERRLGHWFDTSQFLYDMPGWLPMCKTYKNTQ